jgi:DNA-binding XRE family transcriptional regulator
VPANEIERAERLRDNYFNNKIKNMATKEIKTYSIAEMKDKYIGKVGTTDRDEYKYELRMDVLGKMIKSARQERHLTQEELGRFVGVQKAQISKLESSVNSATIDTILRVFKALKAEINFNVKLEDNFVKLA